MFTEYLDDVLAKRAADEKDQRKDRQARSARVGKLAGKLLGSLRDCRSSLASLEQGQFQILGALASLNNEIRRQQGPFTPQASGFLDLTAEPCLPDRLSTPASRTEEENAQILNLLASMDNEMSELRTLVSRVLVTLSQSPHVDNAGTVHTANRDETAHRSCLPLP